MRARIAVLAVLATAATLAAVPEASAITRAEATKIALRVLRPERATADVVVFALRKPLAARAVVVEASPIRPAGGRPVGRRAWLFWADLAPYAYFQHPSRLVLVDARTGRVLRRQTQSWYPLIDGKPPPWLRSSQAYDGKRFRVFTTRLRRSAGQELTTPARRGREPAGQISGAFVSPKELAGDCLVSIGNYEDPAFRPDFAEIEALAEAFDIPRARVQGGRGRAELEATVRRLVGEHDCHDVLLFVAGHGFGDPKILAKEGVKPNTLTSPEPGVQTAAPDRAGFGSKLTPQAIREVLEAFDGEPEVEGETEPLVTFKVVLLSCFAGRVGGALTSGPPENLLLLTASSGADEYSFSKFPAGRLTERQPGGRPRTFSVPGRPVSTGEFVRGLAVGATIFVRSEEQVDVARAAGGEMLVRLGVAAFVAGRGHDLARASGLTHPEIYTHPSHTFTRLDMSHQHLAAFVSDICGVLEGTPGARGELFVNGPGGFHFETVFTLGEDGRFAIPAQAISLPGGYTITILHGGRIFSGVYEVPPPPTQGDLPCSPGGG